MFVIDISTHSGVRITLSGGYDSEDRAREKIIQAFHKGYFVDGSRYYPITAIRFVEVDEA